jgi:hypothetical protein
MADKEAEQIKYETEVLKTTVLVTVATTGGSISLLLGDHTPRSVYDLDRLDCIRDGDDHVSGDWSAVLEADVVSLTTEAE